MYNTLYICARSSAVEQLSYTQRVEGSNPSGRTFLIKNMEQVVLVDDDNNQIGVADKATVHSANTPLHRGFSVFIINSKKELLITQRAHSKKTFPGVWSNTVCGHPLPDEAIETAALRRLKDELGLNINKVKIVAPYRYRFADQNGIVENEICPVLIGFTDNNPTPNAQEIANWRWIKWDDFLQEIAVNPTQYSPWSREETQLILRYLSSHAS